MTLTGQRVLLVYGLLGDVVASLRRVGMDYMHGVEDWLRAGGADASVVKLPTAAPVQANATRLATELRFDPRPALIIAHSKGGLETLAALMAPEVRRHCAGFIALQSPFLGSPVADAIIGARPVAAAAMALAKMLRIGSGEGLRDLTTPARLAWMTQHAGAIAEALKQVPVVCVATELKPGSARGRERLHLAAARWMEKQGAGPNDGLVSVSSALLSGAKHLVLPGSHIATVTRGAGRDPAAMIERAVAALSESG